MSCPCDESRDAPDVCDEEPGLCTGDGFLPVLGHAAAPSEPREGAFDHPATRDDFEALRGVGAFDDLQSPAPDLLQSASAIARGNVFSFVLSSRSVQRWSRSDWVGLSKTELIAHPRRPVGVTDLARLLN